MFEKTAEGNVTIPHPDAINKTISAKKDEIKALAKMRPIAYTLHGVTPPPKKAKKAATPVAA